MLLHPFTYHDPQTAKEAAQLLGELKDVRLLAGGTFLINNLKFLKRKGLKTPRHLISLKKIDDLKGIHLNKNSVVIRSMTTLSEIFESKDLKDNLTVLKSATKNIATTPIRNMATIGGNIASRYSWTEMGAVLLALNAELHFLKADGKTEMISVEQFLNNNAKSNHLLTEIHIPLEAGRRGIYKRFRRVSTVDVPMLAVCMNAVIKNNQLTDTRIAVNNTNTFAKRDTQLEKFLNAAKPTANLASEALSHMTAELYDTRSDDYKKTIFRVAIKEAIQELMHEKTQ